MKTAREYAEQFLADSTQLDQIATELVKEVGELRGSRDVTADEFAEILHTQNMKWQEFAKIVNDAPGMPCIDRLMLHEMIMAAMTILLMRSIPQVPPPAKRRGVLLSQIPCPN